MSSYATTPTLKSSISTSLKSAIASVKGKKNLPVIVIPAVQGRAQVTSEDVAATAKVDSASLLARIKARRATKAAETDKARIIPQPRPLVIRIVAGPRREQIECPEETRWASVPQHRVAEPIKSALRVKTGRYATLDQAEDVMNRPTHTDVYTEINEHLVDLDVINKERSMLGKQLIIRKELPEDYDFDARERAVRIEEGLNTHRTMPHMDDIVHHEVTDEDMTEKWITNVRIEKQEAADKKEAEQCRDVRQQAERLEIAVRNNTPGAAYELYRHLFDNVQFFPDYAERFSAVTAASTASAPEITTEVEDVCEPASEVVVQQPICPDAPARGSRYARAKRSTCNVKESTFDRDMPRPTPKRLFREALANMSTVAEVNEDEEDEF